MNRKGPPFYGKYRGVVADNRDPNLRGRLRLMVHDVLGEHMSGWALPSLPYAGPGVGLFLVPPVQANVWVEFEHGNPDYPVWTGCFWADGQSPANDKSAATAPDFKILKSSVGTITLDDTPGAGGITIETSAGMKISLTLDGILIDDGKGATIKLAGPQVSINDDALEVI